jgi:hypothetical protein
MKLQVHELQKNNFNLVSKTLKLLSTFLFLFLVSCHSDDNPQTQTPPLGIEGTWKLTEVNGGITGTIYNYPPGMINWKFNGISQTVIVENHNVDENMQDILPSGTYHYNFVANQATPELCALNIEVNGMNLGCYDIGTTQFTMSQVETDGFLIKLVR